MVVAVLGVGNSGLGEGVQGINWCDRVIVVVALTESDNEHWRSKRLGRFSTGLAWPV